MARYMYTAHTAGGRRTGTLEADSENSALQKLRAQKMTVLDLKLVREKGNDSEKKSVMPVKEVFQRWPIRKEVLELILRQTGSLLHSGVPIITALKAIARTSPGRAARSLDRVSQAVREGKPFSKALELYMPGLDHVTLGLIGVGESNGTLDEMCRYAADLMERARKLRAQMIQTFTYPAIVILGAMGVGYYMVRHVFPVVMKFIQGTGRRAVALPLPTRMVIALDTFLSTYGIYLLLAPFVLAIVVAVLRRYPRSGEIVDSLTLKIPLLGGAFCFHANTMWCRILGSMLIGGLDILAAVNLTQATMSNWVYSIDLGNIKSAVRNGRSLGDSIAATRLVELSPLAHTMIGVSEQSGRLAESLVEASEFSQEQLSRRIELLSRLVEPAILLIVGGFVGLVYFGFFMALFSATRSAL